MADKYENLIKYIKSYNSCLIAFSGGLDSSFLLYAAKEALGDNVVAITVDAQYVPNWEKLEAKDLALDIGVKHEVLHMKTFRNIKKNPPNRCYICKKAIFTKINSVKKKLKLDVVFDGTNFDDLKDYRPGRKALAELNIKSPLLECKFTKQDIRDYSKQFNLKTWNKAPYACLLSRIPHGVKIKKKDLERIEEAELFLINKGFNYIRVRCHGDLARIEIAEKYFADFIKRDNLNEVAYKLKEIGFKYISIDIEGYRTGSMNQEV